jgi:arylsulfatase A-like enzyme
MKNNHVTARNVLFLCCDCLRADRIHGYHRDLIPNIEKLMSESAYFTKAFSVGPNTPNSYPSTFGHVYPSEISGLGLIPRSVETVAETFARNGYYTYGFDAGNAWLSEYFGYDRGFANFKSYLNLSSMPDSRLLSGRRLDYRYRTKFYNSLRRLMTLMRNKAASNELVLNALRKLYTRKLMDYYRYIFLSKELYLRERELEKVFSEEILSQIQRIDKVPFFMWAHFMTTHYPFIPMKQKFSNNHNIRKSNYLRQVDKLVDLYDDCVFTFDHYVGEIVDCLKAKDLFDSTIIIISADHGEILGGKGAWHPSRLIPELIRIPLIIKFDKSENSGQVDEIFSAIGLFPSLFRYLGLAAEVRTDINSFDIQANKVVIENNEFIFFEAREFQDAFKERRRRTKDVSIYGTMNKDSFLEYNSKYCTYEGVEEEGERRRLINALSRHIQRGLTDREKHRLRDKIWQIKL